MDKYLSIAEGHGITTAFVLFDDCWFPGAEAGPQPDPKPGVHNSRWLQSPGVAAARDPGQQPRLKAYVQDICATFGHDPRVLFWDVYNEVGNSFLPVMARPWHHRLVPLVARMLRFQLMPISTVPLARRSFSWIRDVEPDQPLTASIWIGHARLNRLLISLSDIVSFHNYRPAANLERQIRRLQEHGRPLVCTEYLARTAGSTFGECLPVFSQYRVSCFNWGLVNGRTQTCYSWQDHGNPEEPEVWFHDILRPDGSPFDPDEVELIRSARTR
jgi:hypothetical protein